MGASRRQLLILLALCGALLLPIWLVQYPPLLDYPNHLARTFILTHLDDPAYQFRGFYRADWGPYPYLSMDVIVIALQHIVPVYVAGKLYLSLCLLAVPLSVWWLLRQANPGNEGLALLGLVLAYDVFFLMGFGVFQLGLALCFVTVGWWVRYLREPSRNAWAIALALATTTYFAHLIAFGIAGFIIGIYTIAARRRFWDVVRAGVIFLPGMVLYRLSGIAPEKDAEIYYRDWIEKYYDGVDVIKHSYTTTMEALVFWAVVACLLVAWIHNRERRIQWPWVAVLGALLAFYVALPDEIGQSWDIDLRVIPAIFVTLLLVCSIGRRQRIVVVLALAIFAVRITDLTANFVAQQKELREMAAAVQHVPRNARLLPLIDEHPDDDPLVRLPNHFWAYTVIERGARPVFLFDLKGQTPMRITDRIYVPQRPIKEVDWTAVARDYDYVWIYEYFKFDAELAKIGTKVYQSGNLRLYRMSGAQPGR